MRVTPPMPDDRYNNPMRQAELAVYRELVNSDAEGECLYEVRVNINCREIDYALWLQDVARIAMQVKGGQYRVDRGVWYLTTSTGEEKKTTPAKQAWEAALQFHDYLQERIQGVRNPFVVPVIVFPDMEPSPHIEAWSAQAGIHVLFGSQRLVERLVEMVRNARVYFPPTAEEIAEEVALVTPEEPEPAPEPVAMDLQARQVIIHRAEVVNVYTQAVD